MVTTTTSEKHENVTAAPAAGPRTALPPSAAPRRQALVTFNTDRVIARDERRDPRARMRLVGISVGIHVVLIALALLLPARLFERAEEPEPVDVVFYEPDALPPPPEPQELTPPEPEAPEPLPQPEQIYEAEPTLPEPLPQPVAPPRPEPRVVRPAAEPAPPPPAAVEPAPVRAKPQIRTNVFAQKDPETARPEPPSRRTRTAGFASEAAETRSTARVRTEAKVGNFEVAAATNPSTGASDQPVKSTDFGHQVEAERNPAVTGDRAVASTSFGEVPKETASRPSRASGGSVASTGFTGKSAAPAAPSSRGAGGSVKKGQFGDGFAIAQAPASRQRPAARPDTPVEIVSKPKPVYTAEARSRKIEGEVVLEVIFDASGRLEVLRVLGSLGHGLDEAAVEAARKIQFKPARRDGKPIDYTALLHIVFQLA